MSSDGRLDRLGLAHLKDQPEALAKEIEARAKVRRGKEAAFEEKRKKARAAKESKKR